MYLFVFSSAPFLFFSVANLLCSIAFTSCITPKLLRFLLCNLIEIVMIIGQYPLLVYVMLIGWCCTASPAPAYI